MSNILSLIPQKPPFVMIDKLLHCDEHSTQTSFQVKQDSVLVVDKQFTEAGLMENIAQTAAVRAGYIAGKEGKAVSGGYIGAVKNFEIFHLPKVNDELQTEIRIETQVFDMTVISGIVKCADVVVATCEMSIFTAE